MVHGPVGTVKRKSHKSLKSKLDSLGDIDLDGFIEKSLTDPLEALDEAMTALDDMFSKSEFPPPPPAPPSVRRVGGAGGVGGSKLQARMDAQSARHAAMMKRHSDRMERHAARMERHREKIENIGRNHPRHMVGDNTDHKHTIKLRDTNTDTTITVTFRDENSYAVTSNTGTIPNQDEIKRHIRNHLKKRPPMETTDVTQLPEMSENETSKEHELLEHAKAALTAIQNPLFWSRTWRGGRKEPMEINTDSKVTISGHNMFGRKYEVTIDGTVIYVPNLEEYLLHNHRHGNLDSFVEMCTDEEKAILRKIIDGLIALKIAETHHTELKELL